MKKLLLVIGILMFGSFMKAESLDESLDAVSVSLEFHSIHKSLFHH